MSPFSGYFDISVEGVWKWVTCEDSSSWESTLWGPGQPGNGQEDCGAVTMSGTVQDDVCDMFYPYICETTPKGKVQLQCI